MLNSYFSIKIIKSDDNMPLISLRETLFILNNLQSKINILIKFYKLDISLVYMPYVTTVVELLTAFEERA